MNIRVGNYKITSDKSQYVVSEIKEHTDGKNIGLEYETAFKFYPHISYAINSLVERQLKDSDATTLAELRKDLKQIRTELYALFFEKVA